MQDIPLTEARARLGELVDQVRFGGEGVLITRSGTPAAALVPAHVYKQWASQRQRLWSLIDTMRANVAKAGLTEDEISTLVDEAIAEVRRAQTSPEPSEERVHP